MREMSRDEWEAFISEGTRTGKLAIVLPSGRPSVTPVWFVYEDGVIRGQTVKTSAKATAMAREPRVSLLVDMETEPFAFVRLSGEVTFNDEPEEVRRVAGATGARYMGEDQREAYAARNGGADEIVWELRPSKVVAMDDITG